MDYHVKVIDWLESLGYEDVLGEGSDVLKTNGDEKMYSCYVKHNEEWYECSLLVSIKENEIAVYELVDELSTNYEYVTRISIGDIEELYSV